MATDADLPDFVHASKRRQLIEIMTCIDESHGWPSSSAEVPIDLIDEYMDHAEECAYHAELMLLEEEEMEMELQLMFRLARGLDSHGRLLRGTVLVEAIAENERRLASWKKGSEATNSPFNHIALYNGVREIVSCGSFFDFSRHESINELDPQAGLQIRGINSREEKDVLLGSYALAGVRHEGEEQVLPLQNGYTVGLRVIRLDEKTFAVGFRCVDSATMEKLNYRQDFHIGPRKGSDCYSYIENSPEVCSRVLLVASPFRKRERLASAAWLMSLERTWLALVNFGRTVQWNLESGTKLLWKAFTERPNVVQLGSTLLLVILLFEAVTYLRQPHIYSRQQMVEVSIMNVFSSLALSEKVASVGLAFNDTGLEVQSLFLYSDSDLEQMLTVEKLIAGSSYRDQGIDIVFRSSPPSRVAKNHKRPGRTENSRSSRNSHHSPTLRGPIARRCRYKCGRCYF